MALQLPEQMTPQVKSKIVMPLLGDMCETLYSALEDYNTGSGARLQDIAASLLIGPVSESRLGLVRWGSF